MGERERNGAVSRESYSRAKRVAEALSGRVGFRRRRGRQHLASVGEHLAQAKQRERPLQLQCLDWRKRGHPLRVWSLPLFSENSRPLPIRASKSSNSYGGRQDKNQPKSLC